MVSRSLLFSAIAISGLLYVSVVCAQSQPVDEHVSVAPSLKAGSDLIAMPSVGRILGGFIVTVGLALGAVYLLKRFLPNFAQRLAGATSQDGISARTIVLNGVRYHVVKVEEHTVLVAEGRSGVAMTQLSDKAIGPIV